MDVVQRFLTEARVVAQLGHPNIVAVYEIGESEQGYFVAMEYVDGMDLSSVLGQLSRRGERLPIAVAAYVAASLCRALEHAHAARDDAASRSGSCTGT